ncbi:M4 family metallopeptidase [Catenulispora pinistramenti]|uniref:M4 family metallopeptidase n=1 Tax=Catenulispora pinistramenti TaxID=2705254 RepID=UPI001BADD541|nr:M4 family metallopeptidase [Catenulispora pinistramenti]
MRLSNPLTRRRSMRRLAIGVTAGATVLAMSTTMAAYANASPSHRDGSAASPAAIQALAARSADALVATHPAFLMAAAQDQFQRQQVVSAQGTQYVPYLRTHAGLPVVGGDFVIVTDSAGHTVFHSVAQQHPIGALSTTPKVSSTQGAAVAEHQLKQVSKVEATKLVVFALGNAPAALAWETTVDGMGSDGVSRLSVDVDAGTGRVLHTQEHVTDGTANAVWNGPEPLSIDTTDSGGTYSLAAPDISGLACQDAANNTTFTNTTDSWGNGDATDRETACADALYSAETENHMLSQWLGRNSFDGNGGAWPIRVGLDDVNAYYDGSEVQVGHNTAGQWITAMDVVDHEMGHGIDDHTPGGISGNGTQEFIADVYGQSSKAFANEPSPYAVVDWVVGAEVNLEGTGPIRNLYDPSQINGDPDCYSDAIPGDEVHQAAGPGNHWFYLLAQGSNPSTGPTSPTCDGSTVTGIGVENALKIVYNAQLMKNSDSSYLAYRTWTLQAAINLDPTCAEFNTVQAAWNAVSVPAQSGDPTCSAGGSAARR